MSGASAVSILGLIDEVSRHRDVPERDVAENESSDRFERLTNLAEHLFGVRAAVISLVDHERLRLVLRDDGLARAVRPAGQFTDRVVRAMDTVVVPDVLLDEELRTSEFATGIPRIRFFAGHPILGFGGEPLGALCIMDGNVREFTKAEQTVLRDLALWVQNELMVAHELDRAAEVQRGLLPKKLLSLPGFQVAGGCAPARAVGGDFYDWYPIGEGVALTLADVMGKGIGSAIIAATVRAVLRAGSRRDALESTVEAAAANLEADLDEAGTFVTLFYARLDMDSGLVRYIDAGHGLTLVVRADGTSERLATTNFPLGAGIDTSWDEHEVALGIGDTLVSVSDGVLDLFDGSLDSLGEIEAIVRGASSAQDAVDELMRLAGTTAPDDVTMLVVRHVG